MILAVRCPGSMRLVRFLQLVNAASQNASADSRVVLKLVSLPAMFSKDRVARELVTIFSAIKTTRDLVSTFKGRSLERGWQRPHLIQHETFQQYSFATS